MRNSELFVCLKWLLPVLLLLSDTRLSAADARPASARELGIALRTAANRLWVAQVHPAAGWTLRPGDQIVAVNGRRVATEAAFMNHVANSRRGGTALTIARNGRLQTAYLQGGPLTNQAAVAPAGFAGGSYLDKSQMVLTPRGAMHIEAARRLGLPHTPFPGGNDH